MGPVETVDVIMPAFNEAAGVEAAVAEIDRAILGRLPGSRLIVVDDGGTDGTGPILDRLARGLAPRLVVIHQANAGHGPALMTGLAHSRAPWVLLIDADRQQDAEDFWRLWARRQGAAMVVGVRQGRWEGPGRALISRTLRLLGRLLFGARLADVNAPFKLIGRPCLERLTPLLGPKALAPSAGLALAASALGLVVAQEPVAHRARRDGPSRLIGRRLLRLCWAAALELWRLRLRLARAR